MQKQKLWHAFQEKNKELEMQHRQQLEHKFQVGIEHIHILPYAYLSPKPKKKTMLPHNNTLSPNQNK